MEGNAGKGVDVGVDSGEMGRWKEVEGRREGKMDVCRKRRVRRIR